MSGRGRAGRAQWGGAEPEEVNKDNTIMVMIIIVIVLILILQIRTIIITLPVN